MEIIMIFVISIIYIIMLSIILKAYYRDQEENDKRVLQLEKRIEEYRKTYNNYYKNMCDKYNELEDLVDSLRRKRK